MSTKLSGLYTAKTAEVTTDFNCLMDHTFWLDARDVKEQLLPSCKYKQGMLHLVKSTVLSQNITLFAGCFSCCVEANGVGR